MEYFSLFLLLALSQLSFGQSQNIRLLGQWNTQNLDTNGFKAFFNDGWGYARLGREYGIIGSTYGTHIIDVTNPTQPEELFRIKGKESGKRVTHRDFKTYKNYLYAVCDQGNSSLQIIDLSRLPSQIEVVYDSSVLVKTSHNLFVDEGSERLYVCGNDKAAMSVYSLKDPTNPELLGHFSGALYVHDVFARNDTAYLSTGNQGLLVVDYANPGAPLHIGKLEVYEGQGYNHNGWLNPAGTHFVFTDENHGLKIKVCDVTDLDSLRVVAEIGSDVSSTSVAHNVIMKDNFVYASYYHDGLQIFDLKDPENPRRSGFYDTFSGANDSTFLGAWGIYPYLPSGRALITDMTGGLFVLDPFFAVMSGEETPTLSSELSVYPNPVEDQFIVSLPDRGEDLVSLVLLDLQGRGYDVSFQLKEVSPLQTMECQLPKEAAPGLYILVSKFESGLTDFQKIQLR